MFIIEVLQEYFGECDKLKYTGRIITTFISMLVGIPYTLYNYFSLQSFGRFIIDSSIMSITCIICWWLGKQFDRAKYFSEKDDLTGLYNRRFVEALLPKLIAQVDRNNKQLCVSILDCNNFKKINDNYGHKTGDLVLRNFSDLLLSCNRDGDIVARWGGDEFVIIAPFTDRQGIEVLFNRIEQKLLDLSKKIGIDISISVGVAVYPTDGNDIDHLIKIADQNMYRFKTLSKQNEHFSL